MRKGSFPLGCCLTPHPSLCSDFSGLLLVRGVWNSGNKAPGKQGGAVSHFPKKQHKEPLADLLQEMEFMLFLTFFVSTGHFSFIFCVLKYISNYCYVIGKWHSYFSNDLIYRFIRFRARRDYYDLQSCGQSHLPDDSLLQAQRFWPSDNLSSEREPCQNQKAPKAAELTSPADTP